MRTPVKLIWFCMLAVLLIDSCQTKKPVNYYVSSQTGDDTYSGTSPAHAFRTLEAVNRIVLKPGDSILLAGGEAFKGTLVIDSADCGTAEGMIVITSSGGAGAVIDAGDSAAIKIKDTRYIHVSGLTLKGSGRKDGNVTSGLIISRSANIKADHIEVSGFQKAGVHVKGCDRITLTNIRAFENGACGILASDEETTTDIYIADCVAENNPGDPTNLTNHSGNGILLGHVRRGMVEYCMATNNGWDMPWTGNGPVGIWAYYSDSVIIQHCISHHNKTNKVAADGGGFDFDGGMTNSVMQYNLSYNNEGAGYGLFQYWGAPTWANNIIRYNISLNDGSKNSHAGIHVWSAEGNKDDMYNGYIYNNIVLNENGHGVRYETDIRDMYFYNNIFIAGGEQLSGSCGKSRYDYNVYWSVGNKGFSAGKFGDFMNWVQATGQEKHDGTVTGKFADPGIIMPSAEDLSLTDPRKLRDLKAFMLMDGSACLSAGRYVENNGALDFWGNPLPAGETSPDIGAHQKSK